MQMPVMALMIVAKAGLAHQSQEGDGSCGFPGTVCPETKVTAAKMKRLVVPSIPFPLIPNTTATSELGLKFLEEATPLLSAMSAIRSSQQHSLNWTGWPEDDQIQRNAVKCPA